MKVLFYILSILMVQHLFGQISIEPARIGIFVSDVEKASSWYEDNLDFKTYKKMEFPEYDNLKIYFLKNGTFEIELIEKTTSFSIATLKPDYNMNSEPLEGFFKITFKVNDIDQVYHKLKDNGVKEMFGLTYDQEFDQYYCIIMDGDGNVIQLIGQIKK